MAQRSDVPSESEEFLGILLFGVGLALLPLILAPSSGGVGFLVALVAEIQMAGGLVRSYTGPVRKGPYHFSSSIVRV